MEKRYPCATSAEPHGVGVLATPSKAMSDLYDLLRPHLDASTAHTTLTLPTTGDQSSTKTYLDRLGTLSLADLTTTEPSSLLHASQFHLRNLQALAKRSHKAVIESSSQLDQLTSLLPDLNTQIAVLQDELPALDSAATTFAAKYDRSTENAVLDRRKRALLLSRNVDRVSDVLDLPSLLSSTIATAQTSSTATVSSSTTSYASALDLQAHIKRLYGLYPQSELVGEMLKEAEGEMQNLTTILITSLQSPTLKLAGAMRLSGWLRRIAPDLAEDDYGQVKTSATSTKALDLSVNAASADGALGNLFLVCRLCTLYSTLEALEPLRELADQETSRRTEPQTKQSANGSTSGTQSERYVKRYVEIFREQSFNIVSMYKSIFPSGLPTSESEDRAMPADDALLPLPSPLASFSLHLVDMLTATLREYLPNIQDKQARESLLTQVLYCAGSLGRMGADFGMMISMLADDEEVEAEALKDDADRAEDDEKPEWVHVMEKHRIQAGRLEVLARGVGHGRKSSVDVTSPLAMSAA
nr:conserved oligomeric golgi complex subunit 8 [Quercus suber]